MCGCLDLEFAVNQNHLMFFFGRIISILIERVPLNIPALQALAQECRKYSSADRPATKDFSTSLNNLIL